MFLTFLGIVAVVIASYIHDTVISENTGIRYHLYILLMLLALLLYSFQKIAEEYILLKAEFATRRFVGIQGIIGVGVIFVLQMIVILIVFFQGNEDPIGKFFDSFMSGKSLVLIGRGKDSKSK